MRRSDDFPLPLYGFLQLQKPVKAAVDRKAGELPFDDPGKPHESADVVEADRPEGFLRLQNLETCVKKPRSLLLQNLVGKRFAGAGENHFHQFSVIVGPHLLGDEQPAGFQQPSDLRREKVAVPIDDDVERFIRKRNPSRVFAFAQVDPQRQQPLLAELYVGRIALGRSSVLIRVPKGEEKLPAARIIIKKLHFIF